MGFVVVEAEEGLAKCVRHGLPRFETNKQCRRQARSLRGGNGVKLRSSHACFTQGGLSDRQKIAQMLASGEFRDDTSVFGMKLNLRGNYRSANTTVHDYGRTGFIT